MKICFKCKQEKSIDCFYKHSGMKDGHLNKCIDCTKKDTFGITDEDIEKRKKRDRNRKNADIRVENNKKRLQLLKIENPEKYEKIQQQKRDWNVKNKHKKNAHLKVQRAIIKGSIIRLYNCEHCNTDDKLQAHHNDYNKPLEVIWLCIKCHAKEHIRLREIERQKRC